MERRGKGLERTVNLSILPGMERTCVEGDLIGAHQTILDGLVKLYSWGKLKLQSG